MALYNVGMDIVQGYSKYVSNKEQGQISIACTSAKSAPFVCLEKGE